MLKNKEYCIKIKEINIEIENSETIENFCNKWEFLKYKSREFSKKKNSVIKLLKKKENRKVTCFRKSVSVAVKQHGKIRKS